MHMQHQRRQRRRQWQQRCFWCLSTLRALSRERGLRRRKRVTFRKIETVLRRSVKRNSRRFCGLDLIKFWLYVYFIKSCLLLSTITDPVGHATKLVPLPPRSLAFSQLFAHLKHNPFSCQDAIKLCGPAATGPLVQSLGGAPGTAATPP